MPVPRNAETYKGEPFVFPHFSGIRSNAEYHYYLYSSRKDRTLQQYYEAFGFPIADRYRGRKVLDLGAGALACFARQMREQGVSITSVNPCWRDEDYRYMGARGVWTGDRHSVAAVAQELPFADNSFDLVLSLWGIPTYLPGTKGEYVRAFREINRVMANNGIAIMHPIMSATANAPEFKEALDEGFDTSYLLTNSPLPKIFAEKNVDAENREFTDLLRYMVDRPTALYL